MLVLRRFGLIAAFLALALVAAACGGGDDTATPTTSGGGGDAATTTTTTVAAVTTTTEPQQMSGDSGSTYCERIRALEDEEGESPVSFSFFNMTPDEIEAQFKKNLEIFEEWVGIAPSEIEDDAQVVLDAYRRFVERGNELQWNLEAMGNDVEFTASFDEPELTTAADNLEAYGRDVCGVDFSDVSDPGTSGGDPGDDPIAIALNAFQLPAGLFSEEDVECMRTEVGPDFIAGISPDWVPSAEDIAVLLGAIETCGISLG